MTSFKDGRLQIISSLAVLALAACAPYPGAGERAVVAAGVVQLQPSAAGLALTFGGPSFRLASLRDAGVAAIDVRVEGPGLVRTASASVAVEAVELPGPHAHFPGLPPGEVTVTVEARDAACAVRYRGVARAMIVMAQRAVADVWLVPLAAPEPAAGGCATPSPTPVPSPTATPSPTPSAPPPQGTVLETVVAGTSAGPLAVDVDGGLWISGTGTNAVVRYVNGVATPLWLPGKPTGIAAGPRGVWIAMPEIDQVALYSHYQNHFISATTVDKAPCDVAIDAQDRVWVVHENKKNAYVLDPSGNVTGTYRVEKEPHAIAIGPGGLVWVASAKRDLVQRLDLAGALLGETGVGAEPSDVAVGPGGHAFVAASGQDQLWEVDTDGHVRSIRGVGDAPVAVLADRQGRIWVANAGDGTVSVVGPTGTATHHVGGRPAGLALAPSGDVWVSDALSGTVKLLAQ